MLVPVSCDWFPPWATFNQGGALRIDSSYENGKIISFPISYTSFGKLAGGSSDGRAWMLFNETTTGFTAMVANATTGIVVNWLSAGK